MSFISQAELTADPEILTDHTDRLETLIDMIGENRTDIDANDWRGKILVFFTDHLSGHEIGEGILLLNEDNFDDFESAVIDGMEDTNNASEDRPPTYEEYLNIFVNSYIDVVTESTKATLREFRREIEGLSEDPRLNELLNQMIKLWEHENKIPHPIYFIEYYTWLHTTEPEQWTSYESYLAGDEGGDVDEDEWYTELPLEEAEEVEEKPKEEPKPVEVIPPPAEEEPQEEPQEKKEADEDAKDKKSISIAAVQGLLAQPAYKVLSLDKEGQNVIYAHRGQTLSLSEVSTIEDVKNWKNKEDEDAINRILEEKDIMEFFNEFAFQHATLGIWAAVFLGVRFMMAGGITSITDLFGGDDEENKTPKSTFESPNKLMEDHFGFKPKEGRQLLGVHIFSLASCAALYNEDSEADFDTILENVEAEHKEAVTEDLKVIKDLRTDNSAAFAKLMAEVFQSDANVSEAGKSANEPTYLGNENLSFAYFLTENTPKKEKQMAWTAS
ncbi:hypothetical protein HN748_02065 [Candidatus Peregrinibacteria bacterium]|jgi:hypothetical protein|nr:hypothetical protein [Candidatus Peregrinibacteria bacterium]MBT7483243.1 hypothetical protein [Candidatus Peregrinibacteria bacterium]MBT7702994.1 hypothetical protein [Candidatus Peregrinibacteria bacterium]